MALVTMIANYFLKFLALRIMYGPKILEMVLRALDSRKFLNAILKSPTALHRFQSQLIIISVRFLSRCWCLNAVKALKKAVIESHLCFKGP